MLTYKYLERTAFGKYCRDCLNYLYDLNIKQEDYIYYHGQHKCEHCGNLRHIVSGIKKGKRLKVWFGAKPEIINTEDENKE